jgi:hypothetical protein
VVELLLEAQGVGGSIPSLGTTICGRSTMAVQEPSKLMTRVRISSPVPFFNGM